MTIGLEPDLSLRRAQFDELAIKAFETGEYQGEFLTFSTISQFFRVFSPNRVDLLQKLQKVGPSSLRALARELGRDVKRVHEDAQALLAEGLLERDETGKLFVPFASIRFEAEFSAQNSDAA